MDFHAIREVIIVDDDPIQHLIFERMFKLLRNETPINYFFDGLQAITYLGKRGPEQLNLGKFLIFLDLNMPVMNGFEFLEKHGQLDRSHRANDHVVVLSSTVSKSEKLAAIDFRQLKGYFEKPLQLEALKSIIAELTD